MRTAVLLLALLVVAVSASPAHAGEDMSDTEFATWPAIVIARWTGDPLERRDRSERGVVVQIEHKTSIVVDRVLRGAIKPGRHDVLLQDQVFWGGKDGGPLWRVELGGRGAALEVEQIHTRFHKPKQEAVWFLRRGRSWDKGDTRRYWVIDRVRCVQEARYEPYVRALLVADPPAAVASLLTHSDRFVVARALEYLCGERPPGMQTSWLTPGTFSDWTARKPHPAYADRIKPLLQNPSFDVRMNALAAYAFLAGKAAVPELRRALLDPEVGVCSIAVANLARLRDEESIDAINRAALSVLATSHRTFNTSSEVIRQLDAWDQPKLMPALICMLQDLNAKDRPDFPTETSLYAQEVLYRRTGFLFPVNRVHACLVAWKRASMEKDPKKRLAILEQRLPEGPAVLGGRLVADPDQPSGFVVEIENRGRGELILAKEPTSYEYGYDYGGKLELWLGPRDLHSYLTLRPGERMRTRTPIPLGLFSPTRVVNYGVAYFTKPFRKMPERPGRWLGGVWIKLPPRAEQVVKPTGAQENAVRQWLKRYLNIARSGNLHKARDHMSWFEPTDPDSWLIDMSFWGEKDPPRDKLMLGVIEAALESGAPTILRIDVLGRAESKDRGPVIHVKVRFGKGPGAETLMLVLRRVQDRLLLGRVRSY